MGDSPRRGLSEKRTASLEKTIVFHSEKRTTLYSGQNSWSQALIVALVELLRGFPILLRV